MEKFILLTFLTSSALLLIVLLPKLLEWRAGRYTQYAEAIERLDFYVRRLIDKSGNEPRMVAVAGALVYLSANRGTARQMLRYVARHAPNGEHNIIRGRLGELFDADPNMREDYRQALLACFDAVTANSPFWGSVLRVQTASPKSETIVREAARDYRPATSAGLAGAHC